MVSLQHKSPQGLSRMVTRADNEVATITRGLPRGASSYADLTRTMLERSSDLTSRGIILGGAAEQGYKLQSFQFVNPKEQAHWYIRYQPKKD